MDRIDAMKNRVDFLVPKRKQTSSHLDLLLEAAIEQKALTIEYWSSKGVVKRDIQPIGIYAESGFWFCPAYCCLRGDYRLFRADRIFSASYAVQQIDRSAQNAVDLTNWVSILSKSRERMPFVIELSKSGVERYQEEVWLWPMPDLQVNADGTGIIQGTIPVQEMDYFSDHWFRYGKHAVVKEPKELVEKVRRHFVEALQQYDGEI